MRCTGGRLRLRADAAARPRDRAAAEDVTAAAFERAYRRQRAARNGALDAVRRRADLATVSVVIEGNGRPVNDDGGGAWTPRDALHDAGRVLEVAGGVALIALAVLAPLAILAALAWLAARTLRRRRRETALDRPS